MTHRFDETPHVVRLCVVVENVEGLDAKRERELVYGPERHCCVSQLDLHNAVGTASRQFSERAYG